MSNSSFKMLVYVLLCLFTFFYSLCVHESTHKWLTNYAIELYLFTTIACHTLGLCCEHMAYVTRDSDQQVQFKWVFFCFSWRAGSIHNWFLLWKMTFFYTYFSYYSITTKATIFKHLSPSVWSCFACNSLLYLNTQ